MNDSTRLLYHNYDDFDKMPRRGCFTARGVGVQPAKVRQYCDNDLLDVTGVVYHPQNGSNVKVWHMTQTARDLLDEYVRDERALLPCGHTGFQNCPDSEFYRCKECGGRFTRGEIEGENDVIGVSPTSE